MKHKKIDFPFKEDTCFHNNYIPNFRCFIYNSLNFKSALRDERVKKLFHLFENQHLYFLNVGFFLHENRFQPIKT